MRRTDVGIIVALAVAVAGATAFMTRIRSDVDQLQSGAITRERDAAIAQIVAERDAAIEALRTFTAEPPLVFASPVRRSPHTIYTAETDGFLMAYSGGNSSVATIFLEAGRPGNLELRVRTRDYDGDRGSPRRAIPGARKQRQRKHDVCSVDRRHAGCAGGPMTDAEFQTAVLSRLDRIETDVNALKTDGPLRSEPSCRSTSRSRTCRPSASRWGRRLERRWSAEDEDNRGTLVIVIVREQPARSPTSTGRF